MKLPGFQLEACAHPFFDNLRDPNVCLPNGQALPPLFNFTAKGKQVSPHHYDSLKICHVLGAHM